jgi:hypothetical protein
MTSLELLVRPFQTKDVTPPRRIIGAEKPVDPVNVTIGSAGGTAFVFRAFAVIEFKTEDSFTYREIDRKTHVTRIENPDDPSQFVEVERIDQIALRHKLNPDDKRIYQIKSKD